MLEVSQALENFAHETSQPETRFKCEEDAQANFPGADGTGGSLGCAG